MKTHTFSSNLRDSMNMTNYSSSLNSVANKKPQYSSRIASTPSANNRRGISSDLFTRGEKSSSKADAYPQGLITQQLEGDKNMLIRPITSSPAHVNPNKNFINSPRQDNGLGNKGLSSSVAPSNRIYSSNGVRSGGLKFLPDKPRDKQGKKTLILDLDETLVHSAFKPFGARSDILLNVELERKVHVIHVLKRPGAEEFLERMSRHYEIVIFTASLSAVRIFFNIVC
jgi:TFIIF-interacting CTD phosphatase-like protein